MLKIDDFQPLSNDSHITIQNLKLRQKGQTSDGGKLVMDIPKLLPNGMSEEAV